ncbi:MAG: hypothetical protein A2145_06830 [candidate division Zixibacteria bacterium RBG_16_40_9]|nr:MAG: hypothetical protein A2145_06830 [candidate division Zixibacteria bacterium RBG_16_40_9]
MGRIITLTTDFGENDYFVGAVKGVILSINPKVKIVDITHQLPTFNPISAAFTLKNFYNYFPAGTTHLAVVDPGVGGKRRPVLVQTEKYSFIGPDNGIFSWIGEPFKRIIHLNNSKYFLSPVSSTFQARDIFAPTAAYLSLGIEINQFGKPLEKIVKLEIPKVQFKKNKTIGEIIHVDNFGNLISNIRPENLKAGIRAIKIKGRKILKISQTFSRAPRNEILTYWGSAGFLEIGVNCGSAAQILKAKIGEKVEIVL